MSYESDQDKWIKEVGLRVGDKVLVVASAEDEQGGWDNTWTSDMTEMVGHTVTIDEGVHRKGCGIAIVEGYRYPFFVLLKIN
jgi:hypothetical protein